MLHQRTWRRQRRVVPRRPVRQSVRRARGEAKPVWRRQIRRRLTTRNRTQVPVVTRQTRPSTPKPRQPQFIGRVNSYRPKEKLLPGIVSHTQMQHRSIVKPKEVEKPSNPAPIEQIKLPEPIKVNWDFFPPIEPVKEKSDLFDKYLRFHVGEIVYSMMNGNHNAKWTTQTTWPIQLQRQFDIKNEKQVWTSMISETIPFAFVRDPSLQISSGDIDKFHYMFYELNRLKLTYDIVYIHYAQALSKKSFPGLSIYIPLMIQGVRSYVVSKEGAQKLNAHIGINASEIPDLRMFCFAM